MSQHSGQNDDYYRAKARALYDHELTLNHECCIQFDDEPVVDTESPAAGQAWVQCWILVEDTEEADEQRRIDDREQLRAEEAVLDTQVWEEDVGRHMR